MAFLLKKRLKEVPLWLFFLAVQFLDIIAFTLVLVGVEKISYNPTANPFLRTSIDYVPFTHSLSGSFIIALAVALVLWRFKDRRWGIYLSLAVVSHWFIDFISHTRDMPLLFDSFKVGLGLWNFPWPAFLLEVLFFILSGYYLFRGSEYFKRASVLIVLLVVFYSPVMFVPEAETPVEVVSIMSLVFYISFALLAWWIEKKKNGGTFER